MTYDHPVSCHVDACLTAPYWIWGPEYARIAEQVKAGTYTAGYEYFDADSKAMGLFGFMEGETPQPGIADLPEADVQLVKDTLAKMLAGEFGALRRRSPVRSSTTPARSSCPLARSSSSPISTSSRPARRARVQDLHVLVERGHHRRAARAVGQTGAAPPRRRRSSDPASGP